MQNLYEIIKGSLFFNKFVLGDLVCIEYSCPLEDEHMGIFTQSDYIIHVLSGKKTWKTPQGKWEMKAGETLFVKKGAAVITQYLDEEFCMLGFFIPDDLIRESLNNVVHHIPSEKDSKLHQFTATQLTSTNYLEGFFQSMLTYFQSRTQPPDSLIKLKLRELLINIIYHCENVLLKSYLKQLVLSQQPSLPHIMETNFCFNLKLEEYAKLSHRSLSSFKRDFFNHYNMTPGKWLVSKRLEYAANLLRNSASSISQVAFESGFEDVSHFSRAFKRKFKTTPTEFRSADL